LCGIWVRIKITLFSDLVLSAAVGYSPFPKMEAQIPPKYWYPYTEMRAATSTKTVLLLWFYT